MSLNTCGPPEQKKKFQIVNTCRESLIRKNYQNQIHVSRIPYTTLNVNPQAGGMAVARPNGFEYFSRGHFTAKKIQNITNVKFRSLALIFNSKFDHKLF